MLIAYEVLLIAQLCLVIYCALNVITTPPEQIRNLPKLVWLLLVILFPVVGGIAWLVAGRPQRPGRSLPGRVTSGIPPEYDRPGRAIARNPDDDAAFLAELKARAEQQRKRAAEQAQRRREEETPPPA